VVGCVPGVRPSGSGQQVIEPAYGPAACCRAVPSTSTGLDQGWTRVGPDNERSAGIRGAEESITHDQVTGSAESSARDAHDHAVSGTSAVRSALGTQRRS
jgi:hypothetical protein